MKKFRFLSLLLVLSMILSVLSTGFVVGAAEIETQEVSAEVETAQTSANLYGLADNIQQGQILQCWTWSYKNIEANLQKIAEQGFSAIQTSPIQPIKESTGEYWNTIMNSSWVIYQPVAFNIEDNYRNVQGTKTEFKSMCEKAHKFGIKVIVDTVFNHMANDMSGNTIHPWIPSEIRTNSSCWHDISKNTYNFSDRYEVTQYCLTGLPDLNTSNSIVQKHCKNFMKEAIAAGADGFRFDAVKHIETPWDDSSFRSDFWPNVLNAATEYAQETRGFTPYYYGELLGSPGGSLSIEAYTQYMSVSDPGSSDKIRNGVCNGNASNAASGSISNGAAKNKAVQWTESHDNHKDNGTNFVSENNINKTWAMIGAKSEVCALYLARPKNMDTTMMGDADQTSWTYPEVKAVNRFNNAFIGRSEYLSSYYNLACIERGDSGMIIVNTGGTYYDDMSAPVHKMASGTYKDAITGNTFTVSGGYIKGDIGDTGIAVVYNQDNYGAFSKGNITDFAVVGSFNDWSTNANKLMASSANTASTEMYLDAGTYTFKVSANGIWYGNSSTISDTTGEGGWTMKAANDDNCTLKATGGKYTFTFNITTGKLVILHEKTTSRESDIYLKGTFNDWTDDTPLNFDQKANTVSADMVLDAGTYTFKIDHKLVDSWFSNSGTITDATSSEGWTMKSSVSDNCTLKATGGTYRFTLNPSTMKLVVEKIADIDGVVKYSVVFCDYDGTEISVQEVERGQNATAPADPTRPADAQYTYTFSGWDKSYKNITKATTITATYSKTVNKYTVTFLDWDGTLLYTTQVEYGSAANIPPVEPERENYTFSGWDKDFSKITGDITVTALYKSNVTFLKGTFNDWTDANVMAAADEENVVYTNLKLDAGTYTFKIHSKDVWYGNSGTINDNTGSGGWTMKSSVSTKCTLVATGGTYRFTLNLSTMKLVVEKLAEIDEVVMFTVEFCDYDGTVISTQRVEEGTDAIAPADPTRPATAQFTYTFSGWDTDFTNVTKNTTVNALYTETVNEYTVTFTDWNGTVLSTQQVEYGNDAKAPADPTREEYSFSGWDKEFTNVTEDITVTALYTMLPTYLKGTFNDWKGTNLMEPTEDENILTTTIALEAGSYKFKVHSMNVWYGNNGTIDNTTTTSSSIGWLMKTGKDNCTLKADGGTYIFNFNKSTHYLEIIYVAPEYTVTFKDYDGTVLDTQTVTQGKGATAPTAPAREGNAQYSYTFKEWDADFSAVTSDLTVTAVYTQTVNNYKVEFVDFDGAVLSTQQVEYGSGAKAPENPTREGYTFKEWDKEFTNITEDTTVNALYTKNQTKVNTGSLRVRVSGGSGFTISVNGSAARPQGASYHNSRIEIGSAVTVASLASSDQKFMGWVNSMNGVLLSSDPVYTFVATGNDSINALYNIEVEGAQLVTFKHDRTGNFGRILEAQYYAETDDIEFPDTPTAVGYEFTSWSMTEAEIQTEIAKGNDVTVTPVWEKVVVPVQITVNGGSGSGEYAANFGVTVVADKAPEGQKFAYWTDNTGKVRSYDETYVFYPVADTTLTAVFVDEDEVIDYQILVDVYNIDTTSVADKNLFYCSWYVPKEYTLHKAGIVAVNKSNYNESTFNVATDDSNVYVRYSSSTNSTGTFCWTKGNVMSGDEWVARAFVQYVDSTTNEIVTVYSDLAEAVKE